MEKKDKRWKNVSLIPELLLARYVSCIDRNCDNLENPQKDIGLK